MKSNSPALTVASYIRSFPTPVAKRLRSLRSLVKQVVPRVEEKISYGLVGYKLHEKPLIYFGGFKKHVGLYATPAGYTAFKKELAPYKTSKGSVQFPHDASLPLALIRRMIALRAKQVREKK